MNIVYTCDNNYIWIMGISVISLFENNKEMDNLDVYLLGEMISIENKKLIRDIGKKYKRTIHIIDVPKFDIPETIISARWPLSAFTRLFSGELLPETIKKVLYLDCDTIISGEINELVNWDMGGNIFSGVKDCIGTLYKKNIGLSCEAAYVNAGVLLIDLEKLREFDIREKIDSYMNKYARLISYADQDLLNGIFNQEIGYLPPKYDVMTIDVVHTYREIQLLRRPTNFYNEIEMREAIKDLRIIHYTTNMLVIRPWFKNSDHPLKAEFDKYMKMSPWKKHEKKEMKFGSAAKIIKIIQILPNELSYRILGWIHSSLKPNYIKMKA